MPDLISIPNCLPPMQHSRDSSSSLPRQTATPLSSTPAPIVLPLHTGEEPAQLSSSPITQPSFPLVMQSSGLATKQPPSLPPLQSPSPPSSLLFSTSATPSSSLPTARPSSPSNKHAFEHSAMPPRGSSATQAAMPWIMRPPGLPAMSPLSEFPQLPTFRPPVVTPSSRPTTQCSSPPVTTDSRRPDLQYRQHIQDVLPVSQSAAVTNVSIRGIPRGQKEAYGWKESARGTPVLPCVSTTASATYVPRDTLSSPPNLPPSAGAPVPQSADEADSVVEYGIGPQEDTGLTEAVPAEEGNSARGIRLPCVPSGCDEIFRSPGDLKAHLRTHPAVIISGVPAASWDESSLCGLAATVTPPELTRCLHIFERDTIWKGPEGAGYQAR